MQKNTENLLLMSMLQKIERASTVLMDRWHIEVSEQKDDGSPPGDPIPYNIINNYFSVGVVRKFY
jgi:diacylglycerol kinase (ATP)